MPQIRQSDIFGDPSLWTPLAAYGGTPLGAYPDAYGLGQSGYGQQGPSLGGQPPPYGGGAGGYQPPAYGGGAAGYQPPPFDPGAFVGGGGGGQPQSFQDSGGGALTTGLGALSALSAADKYLLDGKLGASAKEFLGNIPGVSNIADILGFGPDAVPAVESIYGNLPQSPLRAPLDPSLVSSVEAPPSIAPLTGPELFTGYPDIVQPTQLAADPAQLSLREAPFAPSAPSPLDYQTPPGVPQAVPPALVQPTLPTDLATGADALFGSGPEAAQAARQAGQSMTPSQLGSLEYTPFAPSQTALAMSGEAGTLIPASMQSSVSALGAGVNPALLSPGALGGVAPSAANAAALGGGYGLGTALNPGMLGMALPGIAMSLLPILGGIGRSENTLQAMEEGTGAAFQAITNPNFGLPQAQRFASLTGLPFDDYGEYGDPRTLETGANVGGLCNRIEAAGGRAALSPSAQNLYDDLRNHQVVLQERKNAAALAALGMPADVVRPAPAPTYSPTNLTPTNLTPYEDGGGIGARLHAISSGGLQPYEDGGQVGGAALPVYRQIQPYTQRLLQQVMPSSDGQTFGTTAAGQLLAQGMSPSQIEQYLQNVGSGA